MNENIRYCIHFGCKWESEKTILFLQKKTKILFLMCLTLDIMERCRELSLSLYFLLSQLSSLSAHIFPISPFRFILDICSCSILLSKFCSGSSKKNSRHEQNEKSWQRQDFNVQRTDFLKRAERGVQSSKWWKDTKRRAKILSYWVVLVDLSGW